ncbi:MAG TPA: hypothetical protein VL547_00345 [Dinghuibacter sp.]|uniref:hypothetical protein n=1 Tax=Dinghuibacter sp. TaxID=2024697 RepID=UPI002C945140|nr:hypothetical protein [Dinghuibacter sp.]HTJ10436.1 hypothetical protein [Dinghuibacter sp.]
MSFSPASRHIACNRRPALKSPPPRRNASGPDEVQHVPDQLRIASHRRKQEADMGQIE